MAPRWRVLTASDAIARCSSSALKNVTFGVPAQVECADASGYSLSLITSGPSDSQVRKMCAVDGCRQTVDAMEAVAPTECLMTTSTNGVEIMLYHDVLAKIESTCGFFSSTSESRVLPPSTNTNSSSTSGDITQTTLRATSGGSGLGVGSIVGFVVGVIGCGLLAAFITTRLKRRRQDLERMHERTGSDQCLSSMPPLDDGDDFYSQRVYAEYATTVLASSKVSSTSRASTVSTKLSHVSCGDLSPRWMSQCAEVVEDPFDDPALIALRIPEDAITTGHCISQSKYVDVLLGVYKSKDDRHVTIKRLAPAAMKDLLAMNQLLAQASALSSLRHERILGIVGVVWDTPITQVSVVTEYAARATLRRLLDQYAASKRGTGFCPEKIKIALHIAEAICFLHSQEPTFLHQDLMSNHVLLTSDLDAKLSGIGSVNRGCSSTKGSLWTAPEVLQGDAYTSQADIYSLGVVLSELDIHRLPYADVLTVGPGEDAVSEVEVLHKVAMGYLSVSFSDEADSDLVALARSCLALDPRERPTAADVLQRVGHIERTYGAFV